MLNVTAGKGRFECERIFFYILEGRIPTVYSEEYLETLAVSALLRFLYILVPGGASMFILTYAFRKVLKRLHKRIQETDGALRVYLQERLESLLIVRSFGREEQTADQARERMEDHKTARLKRNRFSNICNVGFAGLMNGAYLLGIGFCGYGILTGSSGCGKSTVLKLLMCLYPLDSGQRFLTTARAIFSRNPILMLDEATSALDEATAQKLLTNLRSMTHKTVILVTHRIDQAAAFERELVFSPEGIRDYR